MSIAILIPAAGASSRMRGRDKLLERIGEEPILKRVALRALLVSDEVVVTLPPESDRAAVLADLDVKQVVVTDAELGMSASIRAGVAAVSDDAQGVMILPADMPDITADDIATIHQAFVLNGNIIRASSNSGQPGHPVVFPRSCISALSKLIGDQGAKPAMLGQDVTVVPLPNDNAITDLDTPDDWENWRNA